MATINTDQHHALTDLRKVRTALEAQERAYVQTLYAPVLAQILELLQTHGLSLHDVQEALRDQKRDRAKQQRLARNSIQRQA